MSNYIIVIAFAVFGLLGFTAILDSMERDMKVCQLTHSYDVCVTTLR